MSGGSETCGGIARASGAVERPGGAGQASLRGIVCARPSAISQCRGLEQYPAACNQPAGGFAFLNKELERWPIAYPIGCRSGARASYSGVARRKIRPDHVSCFMRSFRGCRAGRAAAMIIAPHIGSSAISGQCNAHG
jgi:hypothetical protein